MAHLIIIDQSPPSVDWQNHYSSTASSTSYSFTVSAGAAKVTRSIIVGIQLSNSFPNSGGPDSVTIGGIGASRIALQNPSWVLNSSSIWIANVPNGTSTSVVVTRSSGATGIRMEVWAAYDLLSTSAIDTLVVNGANPASGPLSTSALGIAVAIASRDTTQTYGWSGVTSDDAGFTVSGVSMGAGSRSGTPAGAITVTATPSSGTTYLLAASLR